MDIYLEADVKNQLISPLLMFRNFKKSGKIIT